MDGMPTINSDTCTNCGLCADNCVQQLFARMPAGVAVRSARAGACVQCGQCMAVCPTEAVQVAGFDYADFAPLSTDHLDDTALAGFLSARRSIRHYRPDPIPRAVLERLLELAATAPMGLPPSAVEVTVLTDPNALRRFAPASFAQMDKLKKILRTPLLGALVHRAFDAETMRILEEKFMPLLADSERALREEGRDIVTWNAPCVLIFHAASAGLCNQENIVIAMTYAMLAAESLGLGSCMNGIIQHLLDRDRALRAQVGLPARCRVFGALLLGYPAAHLFQRSIPRRFHAVHWK